MKQTKSFDVLKSVLSSSDFINTFIEKVKLHKILYNKVKIKSTMFEELFVQSIKSSCGNYVDWICDSHCVGADIKFNDIFVSCKSGTINKGILTISGSRTTSRKTIADKIKFLTLTHSDAIVSFSEEKNQYRLILIPPSFLDFGKSSEWVETPKKWKFSKNENDFFIQKSMSDQLWIKIKINSDVNTILTTPI